MARNVVVTNAHGNYRISRKRACLYVRKVLKEEGIDTALVSLVFVDAQVMRRLNRKFLKHNRATDVISFGLGVRPFEGEVYVNLDAARVQGRRYGVSFGEEMARLIVHGTLHLVGYDDGTAAAGKRMKQKEDGYLSLWF